MSIDATPKGMSANSMATLAEAEAYMAGRLHKAKWEAADDPDKEAALIWASRILSKQRYKGDKSSINQAMAFPRQGLYDRDGLHVDANTIPVDVVHAVSEYAFLLLENDSTKPSGTQGFKQIKVSVIDIKPDAVDRAEGVPQPILKMLDAFIHRGGMVSIGKG